MEQIEWQCPSCTLLNRSSSFKCRACGTPKGTSTRQSKHTIAFEQQYLAASLRKAPYRSYKSSETPYRSYKSSSTSNTRSTSSPLTSNTRSTSLPSTANTSRKKQGKAGTVIGGKSADRNKRQCPKLDNIDRSNGVSFSVTVGEVTVIITEYPSSDK